MSTEARREIGELLADQLNDAEELARLNAVDFLHQGCEMLRRKDNESLIAQRDQARGMVVELEGENAKLEHERDSLLLLVAAFQAGQGRACWRCGGTA